MPQVPQPPIGYVPPACAATQPANPTAPASTSAAKMQGLAAVITPQLPAGNVLCIINALMTAAANTIAYGLVAQLYCGPVTSGVAPPANAGAIPASAVALGQSKTKENAVAWTTAADYSDPWTFVGLARGLTPGQQYWFDVALTSLGTASDNALTNVDVWLMEIA